jgi:hypothetical protein
MYGMDGMNDMSERIIMVCICLICCRAIYIYFLKFLADLKLQCYFYVSLSIHGDISHYACPLDICVETLRDLKVKHVLSVPLGKDNRVGLVSEAEVKPFDQRKIKSPVNTILIMPQEQRCWSKS